MAETKTLNLERIINILKEHKEELKERYGVKGIGVFGSYVRGEYKGKSDLDILVEFEEDADVDLLKFVNMENYLSELIGVKVDLVDRSGLKPRIGKHILKEVIPIWKEKIPLLKPIFEKILKDLEEWVSTKQGKLTTRRPKENISSLNLLKTIDAPRSFIFLAGWKSLLGKV